MEADHGDPASHHLDGKQVAAVAVGLWRIIGLYNTEALHFGVDLLGLVEGIDDLALVLHTDGPERCHRRIMPELDPLELGQPAAVPFVQMYLLRPRLQLQQRFAQALGQELCGHHRFTRLGSVDRHGWIERAFAFTLNSLVGR